MDSPSPPPIPPPPARTEVREEDLTSRRRLRGSTLISPQTGGGKQSTVGSTLVGG